MRLTRGLEARLDLWAEKAPFRLAKFIAPLVGRALRVMIPLLAVIFVPPLFGLPAAYQSFFSTGSAILIIGAVACILFQAVNIFEKALLEQYDMTAADNLQARKIYTQARVISRTLHLAIAVCAVASVLMLFQEVRQIGASLLASAGIVGIVAGVAAQKTLANLIAGFQIALAQPIRLDDVVIAEGEWGRIEEISLTYVVVHIWDDRRLILPLVYFIEKPFQNWTRASAQLLGSVHVWVDYSLPLDEARRALKDIIESHPLWDKRFWNLQVTEATEKTMQLRVLATAGDSSRSWDLRCAIREQFIAFIQKNYPQCLPKIRAELPWREAAETGAMPVPP
ncbi:MAG: mechanosensitive ion channel family protein [Verrucomicrobia bacterium]|nr:mechanosensitive ion channel family protein [Verrucomicrobiota bacterium]MDE3097898.1 mechanosensitive ion channel family protein [Verrucomicrobiota bacterium]